MGCKYNHKKTNRRKILEHERTKIYAKYLFTSLCLCDKDTTLPYDFTSIATYTLNTIYNVRKIAENLKYHFQNSVEI